MRSALCTFPPACARLREVMHRLPPDTLEGVRKIVLCLGLEHQQPDPDDPFDSPTDLDPFVGRGGLESLPGVFSGRYLGTYLCATAAIQLYAYVYSVPMPDQA